MEDTKKLYKRIRLSDSPNLKDLSATERNNNENSEKEEIEPSFHTTEQTTTNNFADCTQPIPVIALAGNPNVGKSTVFNALTGMKQHTGNWSGKTVCTAQGYCKHNEKTFILVDVPGAYSLMATSPDEAAARDCICFGGVDAVAVVVDATCLERNLNLILQILEVSNNVIVCVNLVDEAKKKNIHIDFEKLSDELGVPVIPTAARSGMGLELLQKTLCAIEPKNKTTVGRIINYHSEQVKCSSCTHCIYAEKNTDCIRTQSVIEKAILIVQKNIPNFVQNISVRWAAIRLLEGNKEICENIMSLIPKENQSAVERNIQRALIFLKSYGIDREQLKDYIVESLVHEAERIYQTCVTTEKNKREKRDRKIDKILTSKITGIPIMLLLFGVIFYITIIGANYPSQALSNLFDWCGIKFHEFMALLNVPDFIDGLLIDGMYGTVAWVVSVMLPPMAIFFPLFTLLEDLGYLPRVAFNTDRLFQCANAHGKQSLTTLMGFGCNACGITGCRIIDSKRERLIAILTNSFVPCNGRFPTLIAIITIFLAGTSFFSSVFSAGILLFIVCLSFVMSLLVSKFLSVTILKGEPSSFSLELPPYRRPQIIKTLVRSLLDRTLFVLGRAVVVAAPAGLLIWILANITIGSQSIISYITDFLNPLGQIMGLDGVILAAFLLGFPANEIVMPIALMIYLSADTMIGYESFTQLFEILTAHGWTQVTAVCMLIFTLFHFPCSTSCITVYKETKSLKYTVLAFLLPTVVGVILCMTVNFLAYLF
ncbi:MAG: ferrous iron transport protein B [Acutalibacteraceae bacterium]